MRYEPIDKVVITGDSVTLLFKRSDPITIPFHSFLEVIDFMNGRYDIKTTMDFKLSHDSEPGHITPFLMDWEIQEMIVRHYWRYRKPKDLDKYLEEKRINLMMGGEKPMIYRS
ncbi:MAG: hypothetical protein ACMUIG_09325 [Thermoplasmatota archaeon]